MQKCSHLLLALACRHQHLRQRSQLLLLHQEHLLELVEGARGRSWAEQAHLGKQISHNYSEEHAQQSMPEEG